jgi:hypothetical protein
MNLEIGMAHSVEVVKHQQYRHKQTGQLASIFSAAMDNNWALETHGFTWEVVSHAGSVSRGLGRKPASTLEEANAHAERYAAMTGATVIGGETHAA